MKKAITSVIFLTITLILGCFILFSDNLCSANDLKQANKNGYEIGFNNSDSYKNQLDTLKKNYEDLTTSYNSELNKKETLSSKNDELINSINQLQLELKNTAKLEENPQYVATNKDLQQINEEFNELVTLFENCSLVVSNNSSSAYQIGSTYVIGTKNDGKTYLISCLSGNSFQVNGGYLLTLEEQKYTITEVSNA